MKKKIWKIVSSSFIYLFNTKDNNVYGPNVHKIHACFKHASLAHDVCLEL